MSIIGQPVATQQVRSGHQGGIDTGNINPLYIEQYGGEVEHRFLKDSFMRQFFKFKSVRGTDTITNDRMGHTALQKVSRGVRPNDSSPTFDNISVKVDTIVLARTNQFLLDDFLSHIDVRKEVGIEHGKEIGKFFDESFIVQAIKASQITNVDPAGNSTGGWEDAVNPSAAVVPSNVVRTAPEGFQGGTVVVLNAAGDEEDPDLLELAIQDLCQTIEEKDVDITDAVLLMRPAQYYTLLKNDKLLDKDFSSMNGDYAQGKVLKANGVRLQVTNRFPKQADVGQTHYLSNAGNGNAYDVTQADVNCKVLLMMPKALLAGETIPLTSKVYYSDIELQWFIDSYLAYGVTPNRAEMAGGIYTSTPTTA
ncbi:MAG: putative minor capsid protein 10B [Prokaryotic dsDNA virus sp.]|nr:MAG: putative minor capsid protein 10B [Prokaryotic dsDNA virus sp.]QDP66079.1 MAG: putative minor capsid protein 10B [Prokaryotic dsDNA virus sp.]|tara:strand:- start:9571 stop:10665 length:1095 start_codon:yes stop_codon:yes gene_type:complete